MIKNFTLLALTSRDTIKHLQARRDAYARRLTQLRPEISRLVATANGLVLLEVAILPIPNKTELDTIINKFFNDGGEHQT